MNHSGELHQTTLSENNLPVNIKTAFGSLAALFSHIKAEGKEPGMITISDDFSILIKWMKLIAKDLHQDTIAIPTARPQANDHQSILIKQLSDRVQSLEGEMKSHRCCCFRFSKYFLILFFIFVGAYGHFSEKTEWL